MSAPLNGALTCIAVRARSANAVAGRVVRSIREERTDRLPILSQPHLRFVLNRYLSYYNHRRSHQGVRQRPPALIVDLP